MLHHFVNRGHKLNDLLQLSDSDKMFYIASARLSLEEKVQEFKALTSANNPKT